MNREAWWATAHRVHKESTEHTHGLRVPVVSQRRFLTQQVLNKCKIIIKDDYMLAFIIDRNPKEETN